MKKIIALLLCILSLIPLSACTFDEVVSTDPADTTVESKKKEPKEMGTLAEKMDIELYNKDDITIKATSFYEEADGDMVLVCNIANHSKDDIFVALEYPEINGICSPIQLWADAKKKSETEAYLYIYSDFLELTKITTVTEIAAQFNIYNENNRPISKEYISFTIGAEDYEQVINTDGTAIIDEENVQVIVQEMREGKEGLEVVVCYINNNDYTVKFDITDVSIDGKSFAVEAPFDLPQYTMTYTVFCVYDSDMIYEGVDSESVTEMKITAHAKDIIGDSVASCKDFKVKF